MESIVFDITNKYKVLVLDEFQLKAVYSSIIALGYTDIMSLDSYIELDTTSFYLYVSEYDGKGIVSYCERLDYFENLTGENSSSFSEIYWYDLVKEAGVLV